MNTVNSGTSSQPLSPSRLFAALASHVEKSTRFDGSVLHMQQPEEQATATVDVQFSQTLKFSREDHSGSGRLPAQVSRVQGSQDVTKALNGLVNQAHRRLPGQLQQWMDDDDGNYLRLLPAAPLGIQERVGYDESCNRCSGRGSVSCTHCQSGRISCISCLGRGRTSCMMCSGHGKRSCGSCSGQGVQYFMNDKGQMQPHACSGCYSSGEVRCNYCDGGYTRCNSCSGQGSLQCPSCAGTLRIGCSPCVSTGYQHAYSYINTEVFTASEITGLQAMDEVFEKNLRDLDIKNLPSLGSHAVLKHQHQGLQLRTRYRLSIPQQRLQLQALNQPFVIRGYGPQATIFDYPQIASTLLQADLQALQQALQPGQDPDQALSALQRFTESEVNLVIAESITETLGSAASGPAKSASDDAQAQAARAVWRTYRGLVSRQYINQSAQAFTQALGHIYTDQATRPVLAFGGLSMLLGVIFALWGSHWHWLVMAAPAGAIMSLVWWVFEQVTQHQLAARFQGELPARIRAISRQSPGVRLLRRRMLVGIAICAVLGAAVGHWLPSTQSLALRLIAE